MTNNIGKLIELKSGEELKAGVGDRILREGRKELVTFIGILNIYTAQGSKDEIIRRAYDDKKNLKWEEVLKKDNPEYDVYYQILKNKGMMS